MSIRNSETSLRTATHTFSLCGDGNQDFYMQFSMREEKDANGLPDILQRMARGDKSAVGECLDAYGKLIWSLAKRFGGTREDIEDAVQEIFIDIWRYAARFDPAKSPEGAFVTLIARRRLVDRLRKSKNQPRHSYSDDALENRANNFDENLQMYVEVKHIVDALDKLGSREKQLVRMTIYDGMSHSEIAKLTGLPLGTVKSQIRRGFGKLRFSIGLVS